MSLGEVPFHIWIKNQWETKIILFLIKSYFLRVICLKSLNAHDIQPKVILSTLQSSQRSEWTLEVSRTPRQLWTEVLRSISVIWVDSSPLFKALLFIRSTSTVVQWPVLARVKTRYFFSFPFCVQTLRTSELQSKEGLALFSLLGALHPPISKALPYSQSSLELT